MQVSRRTDIVSSAGIDSPILARKAGGILYEEMTATNVADAFTLRGFVVELVYAQQRYVVAISNLEASSESVAVSIAHSRAVNASILRKDRGGAPSALSTADRSYKQSLNVGNLISSRVFPDNEVSRVLLDVAGPEYSVTYENPRAA